MLVNSLVAALIVEDQNPKSLDLNEEDLAVKKLLEERMAHAKKVRHEKERLLRLIMMPQESWKSREPFFAPEVAADLLTTLSKILPAFKSVAPSVEIRTSPEFMRAFEAAEGIRNEFHHAKVYPLHLLAAALREACEATKMLREAGITEEKVLQTIRAGGDSENLHELKDRGRFGFNDGLHDQLAGRIHHGDRDSFLVNVHADIPGVIHSSRVLLSIEC
jgi:ATP-dependent Clp protease ATP-binding subunit ClpA